MKAKRNKKIAKLLKWFLVFFLLIIFPYPNPYFFPVKETKGLNFPEDIVLPSPPPVPVQINKTIPEVSAEGVLIKDLSSGILLYSKNENIRYQPASTTKIMTALVSMDQFKPEEILTVKKVMQEGRVMGLLTNERISVESLIYGILVHSANDAAFTLAENFPGGIDKFVEKMNEKGKELGLDNTHFTNPAGFDDDEHYTNASDLAKLAQIALSKKYFAKIVGTRSITVSDVDYTYFHELKNVNELLGRIPGVAGVKTGFTQTAGEILVTEVKKNGQSVLFVLLKSRDRFGETRTLIDWVFNNFVWQGITVPPLTNQRL